MKIIIFIDFSSSEFNKDFVISNALINNGHTVLLVNSIEQLELAFKSYDVLLYGNSYNGEYAFDRLTTYKINGLSIEDIESIINK